MNPNYQKPSSILLTIDVEDWFQVENFKQYIPFSTWSERELRVEKNTHRLLDLLDSASCINNHKPETLNLEPSYHPKATFFILGWVAERLPALVKEIHSRGHEVASHGFSHELCYDCSTESLRDDLSASKKLLEDITGSQVFGYRAPSFSINNDILKIIEECGYLYDSSYNSFGLHGRYGKLELDENSKKGIAYKVSNKFYELPVSNLRIGFPFSFQPSTFSSTNFVLPWGGGGYFRLIPFFIFKKGIDAILKQNSSYLFYLHPWEVDPDQPRVKKASTIFKFRHYTNLGACYNKLRKMIDVFSDNNFITCHQYIEN
jgi:peptidoglycan-N-acetylglucosamine deacetylase